MTESPTDSPLADRSDPVGPFDASQVGVSATTEWARVRPELGRGGSRRRSVSQTLLIDLLSSQMAAWQQREVAPISVVDLGGGTGGLAVALAAQGHAITVMDPSPDALAALQRRAAEADLSDYISAIQGDTSDLSKLIAPGACNVVVCHRVLDIVEDAPGALAEIATVLESGLLSLLVSQRYAAVVGQAAAGDFGAAQRLWSDERFFDVESITELLAAAGFSVASVHGIGVISEHVNEAHVERPERFEELYRLEASASAETTLVSAAPLLHVLAVRDS